MYEQIISMENLKKAYLEVLTKLEEKGKSHSFRGFDGMDSFQTHVKSLAFLQTLQKELLSQTPLLPVLKTYIPKKYSNEKRVIYLYTLKDRIKAQAIHRVLEPHFDSQLSENLYSYRQSHPHYLAAKRVAKKYRKTWQDQYFWKGDISDYTESIPHDALKKMLSQMGIDSKIQALLNLFIGNAVLEGNQLHQKSVGLITGVPLIGFFANWYLATMDHDCAPLVDFYLRVGDDFIAIDSDLRRIENFKQHVLKITEAKKLIIKSTKTQGGALRQPFTFLGYRFVEGKIQINPPSVKKTEQRWQAKLRFYPISQTKKINYLTPKFYRKEDGIFFDFIQLLKAYRLVNDHAQMQMISESFYKILTRYFFKTYSSQKQNKTHQLVRSLNLPSLYKLYVQFYLGQKTLSELSVSRHQKT